VSDRIVELDSRRRLSLGKIGNPEHTHYYVAVADDGTITLTPAVIMSAQEAKLLAHPELTARIRAGIDSGVRVPRPDHG
jgi:hypothetical protein